VYDRPSFNSSGEREYYDELLESLKKDSGLSTEQAERLANEALDRWRKLDEIPF
jgi:hypothetical protein